MIWILLSRGEKQYFTHTQPSFVKYCFNQSKLKFISLRRRVMSSIYKQSVTFSLPDQSVEATGDYPKKNAKQAKLV